jgi:hypothetical protein
MASLDRQLTAEPVSAPRGRWREYTQLSRQIKQAGLLDRRRGWYAAKIGLSTWPYWPAAGPPSPSSGRRGGSWAPPPTWRWCSPSSPSSATTPATASSSGPGGPTKLLHANLGVGVSFDWWVAKHNRHHSNPNHEDLDPDIDIPALAFTAGQASSKHGLVRLMARYQGWLFFPLLLLEAAQLHVASVKAVLRGGTDWAKVVEALLPLLHLAGYVTALVLVLSPLQAVVFIVVQQGLFGLYLGCGFAPNHKGMPTLSDADQLDFVRRQVLTSRNVRGSRLVDFVLGGLNYQIEHHPFPNMPRPNLRHAQPLIRAFCQQRGIGYREASLLGSYAEAVRHLHTVGAPLRPAQAAAD